MKTLCLPMITLGLVVLAAASTGSAALLLQDGFAAGGATPGPTAYQSAPDTTDGSDNNSIDGQGPPRLGFTGDWAVNSPFANLTDVIDPAGLTYTDSNGVPLKTTPGHVRYINGFGDHNVSRSASRDTTLTGSMTNFTTPEQGVYISMLLRVNDTILDTFDDVDGDLRGPHVTVQHGSRSINFSIQKNGTTGDVEASAILEKNPGSVDRTTAGVTKAVSPGETVLLVAHLFNDGGDKYQLWINPEDLVDLSASTTVFDGGQAGDSGFVEDNSSFGLESITFDPGSQTEAGGVFEFDEIRIGTTFRSVVPVPEPTSLALVTLLAPLALARRRRVRSNGQK